MRQIERRAAGLPPLQLPIIGFPDDDRGALRPPRRLVRQVVADAQPTPPLASSASTALARSALDLHQHGDVVVDVREIALYGPVHVMVRSICCVDEVGMGDLEWPQRAAAAKPDGALVCPVGCTARYAMMPDKSAEAARK
jgi:hypothetical protein